ncbi:unnamed protein product [Brassica oleracea var. botrytis]|uniref:(rape) hypothetical protein n=1 Tax=Brassica napus TaxID=3708 RepID=A0A816UDF8_BRANA|nr:unnamed protein product [Brassica napus]
MPWTTYLIANNYQEWQIKFCASLILSGLPLQHMWFTTVFVTLRSQLGFSKADGHSYFHIENSSVQPDVRVFSRVTCSTRLSYTATALSTSFAMGLREFLMLLVMISMSS